MSKRTCLICIFLVLLVGGLFLCDIFLPRTEKYEATQPKAKKGYRMLIDTEYCRLYLLEDSGCIATYPVGVGAYDTPSPIGTWKIVNKDMWGEGFGGRWMGLNVPWGVYGIHGTIFPSSIGTRVSGGCIRMENRDVRELYRLVPIGTQVVITGGAYGPFDKELPILIPGDRGSDVLEVQRRLKRMGCYSGELDGIFGPEMEKALYKLQKDSRLPQKNMITMNEYLAMGIYQMD